jgi:hypothetical protein
MIARFARVASGAAAVGGVALLVIGGSAGASSSPRPGQLAPIHGPYAPKIDPANFVRTIDNRYQPFKAGTRFHFTGVKDGKPQTDDEVVLRRTRMIIGVKCTIVRDTVSEHGRTLERTLDYYAQDKQGNVWYMGEDSFELHHGHFVKGSDSWRSGVKGGKPGIIMPAHPQPGDRYRQEYFPPGKVLDKAHVLRLNGHLTVPLGTFNHVLVTSEFSPAEPQTEKKYYAPGVGEIAERVVKGGHEAFKLVNFTH